MWPAYSQRVQIATQINTRRFPRQILTWDYIRGKHRRSTAAKANHCYLGAETSRNTWNPTTSVNIPAWIVATWLFSLQYMTGDEHGWFCERRRGWLLRQSRARAITLPIWTRVFRRGAACFRNRPRGGGCCDRSTAWGREDEGQHELVVWMWGNMPTYANWNRVSVLWRVGPMARLNASDKMSVPAVVSQLTLLRISRHWPWSILLYSFFFRCDKVNWKKNAPRRLDQMDIGKL